VPELRSALLAGKMTIDEVDIGAAASTFEFFTALRGVLRFPDWCGSGWDSFWDAFEDITALNTFPRALLVSGLQTLWNNNASLALEIVIEMANADRSFELAGAQFAIVYVGRRWS
jgi:hypothetical protein